MRVCLGILRLCWAWTGANRCLFVGGWKGLLLGWVLGKVASWMLVCVVPSASARRYQLPGCGITWLDCIVGYLLQLVAGCVFMLRCHKRECTTVAGCNSCQGAIFLLLLSPANIPISLGSPAAMLPKRLFRHCRYTTWNQPLSTLRVFLQYQGIDADEARQLAQQLADARAKAAATEAELQSMHSRLSSLQAQTREW